jgi:hypothetical protein
VVLATSLSTVELIIGKPFTRKNIYLQQLFLESIETGGGAYFDFTGDIDTLASAIPPNRYEHTVLFLPALTDNPIGFNPLHNCTDKPSMANAILEAVRGVWYPSGISTPQLDMYLYASVAAFLDRPNATLVELPYFLDDPKSHINDFMNDEAVRKFWEIRCGILSKRDMLNATSSASNKLYNTVMDPTFRNILGQVKTSFAVTEKTILIASFPHKLGREKASFLASLLLHILPDYPIFLQDGSRLASGIVRDKKYVAASFEYLGQVIPEIVSIADILTVFRIGRQDNDRLEMEFDIHRDRYKLYDLPPEKYNQKTSDSPHVLYEDVCPPLDYQVYDSEKLKRRSRDVHCKKRHDVEQKINEFLTV